jgi:hypothetical protein
MKMGHDVADLESRIGEAITRLYTFGRVHNLVVHGHNDVESTMPPFWIESIKSHLVQIKHHLDDAQAIAAKYTLQTKVDGAASGQTTSGPVEVMGDKIMTFEPKRRPTDSPGVEAASKQLESYTKTLQKATFSKKMAWSLKYREKLTHAVESLERENNALFYLTIPQLATLMYDAVASRLSAGDLRSTSSKENHQPVDPTQLKLEERIQEVAAAREHVARLEAETETQKLDRRLDILEFPELIQADLPSRRTRQMTAFKRDACTVLVEWKEYDPAHLQRNEIIARVSDTTAILNFPPSFMRNLLSSPGFFEDNRSNDRGTRWIGIVYRMSQFEQSQKCRNFRDLLSRVQAGQGKEFAKTQDLWKPALGDRFKLAVVLSQTMLSIHNCGWYHKGFRPENILFFSNAKSIDNPYLLGWDYARLAQDGQKTETVLSWTSDAELYQHPGLQEPAISKSSSRFRLEYDQYQLGCILLEVGYWRLLGDIKRRSSHRSFSGDGWQESWREYLIGKARKLDTEMGSIFSEVVVNLLQGLNDGGRELEFWDSVVLELNKCKA